MNFSKFTNLVKDAIAKAGGVLVNGKSTHKGCSPSH